MSISVTTRGWHVGQLAEAALRKNCYFGVILGIYIYLVYQAESVSARELPRLSVAKVIELFEVMQRHELSAGRRPAVVFTTKLSRLQRKVLRLLKMGIVYDR